MSNTIRRALTIARPPERVWRAIADRDGLAAWMFPNDFEPIVGHRFTFQVPPNPAMKFDGLTVRCEVVECAPPTRLAFTWRVGGPVANTLVTFDLEPTDDGGTLLVFEHAGFDLAQPGGDMAFKGAQYGWAKMLGQLQTLVTSSD